MIQITYNYINKNILELPKGVTSSYTLETAGGKQNVTIVSEGGLYRLVFKSRKPEAEAFVTWVTEEVLPQIRKTGSYSVKKESVTPSSQQVEYHLRIAAALGDVGFSRGVQQAYLLEQDQKQFDSTAGQDIINGWRYTAEIQKYLERCYREL